MHAKIRTFANNAGLRGSNKENRLVDHDWRVFQSNEREDEKNGDKSATGYGIIPFLFFVKNENKSIKCGAIWRNIYLIAKVASILFWKHSIHKLWKGIC